MLKGKKRNYISRIGNNNCNNHNTSDNNDKDSI